MDMIDVVQCIIECEKCGKTIGGYDAGEAEVADDAIAAGWHITKKEVVYCPKCRIRRKKKT